MSEYVVLRRAFTGSVLACAMACATAWPSIGAEETPPPLISADARNAVLAMGKSLEVGGFSLTSRSIREFTDKNGQPLHIFHTSEVTVRRPDRLLISVTGDDGTTHVSYNGRALLIYSAATKKYAELPMKGSNEAALRLAGERLGVDFPLADLLADSPGKAFLAGITAGYAIDTVVVDGVPCRHLFFMEPPGIELELWLENNDRALPHRLIVTYRSLPGEPRFIAEMSNWKTGVQAEDSAFEFQVPEDASRVELNKGAAK